MNLASTDLIGEVLPVMEDFYTIQGEGAFSGKSAYFVRLAGCDVGCHWCDVKESWETDSHPKKAVSEILDNINKSSAEIVVITGGEPFMHDLGTLTSELKMNGYRLHVETSGAHKFSGEWDWICLSPKKFMACREEYLSIANELKIIVYNSSDFKWATEYMYKVSADCRLFLQPEWDRKDVVMPELVEFVKSNPSWEISLQIHKYLNIP